MRPCAIAIRSGTTRNPRRAMTLLEILVVMTVMAILMAIAFPSMRGMNEHNKLRATARELVALTKYARSEAVFGERRTQIFLDVAKQEFWLDLRTPDPKTGEYRTGKNKTQFEQRRTLNKDIWFAEVTTLDRNVIKDKLIALDFFPDGTASPAMVTLMNKAKKQMTVEVLKGSGMAEVTPGSIADKRERAEEEQ